MLLLIFLLQHRGVLPCLQAIPPLQPAFPPVTDKMTTEPTPSATPARPVDYFFQDLERLSEYWTCSNRESVGELLVAFYKVRLVWQFCHETLHD